MSIKNINVGIIFHAIEEESFYNETGRGLITDLWNNIKPYLREKNYKINEIEMSGIFENDYNKAIQDTEKGKYDIIIGDFFITGKRLKKVNFSESLFTLLPLIIYDPEKDKINKNKYMTYLMRIWLMPFIILIIGSIIVSILFHIGKSMLVIRLA